jgi:hypothetical protein
VNDKSSDVAPEMFVRTRHEVMSALAQAVAIILQAPVVSIAATFVEPRADSDGVNIAPRCETLYSGAPHPFVEKIISAHAQAIGRLLPDQARSISDKIRADLAAEVATDSKVEEPPPQGQPS